MSLHIRIIVVLPMSAFVTVHPLPSIELLTALRPQSCVRPWLVHHLFALCLRRIDPCAALGLIRRRFERDPLEDIAEARGEVLWQSRFVCEAVVNEVKRACHVTRVNPGRPWSLRCWGVNDMILPQLIEIFKRKVGECWTNNRRGGLDRRG